MSLHIFICISYYGYEVVQFALLLFLLQKQLTVYA